MFLKRSYDAEIMDDFSIQDKRMDDALVELQVINSFLGGVRTSAAGLKLLTDTVGNSPELKILDVGSGGLDVVLALQKKNSNIKITGLDINKRVCEFIKTNFMNVDIVCGDVKTLPFKHNQFDVVHASLFFHHFKEDEIVGILHNLLELTRVGVVINDLRRSIFAFAGITLLTVFFSKSSMVKNDAPLSVKRGFTKKELKSILDTLNCIYEIKRTWAFRWCVVLYKNQNVSLTN